MDRDTIREFEILTATSEGRPLTQRALSRLEPDGVCSATHPVRDCRELADADFDAVIVAAFERPDAEMARLEAIGVPHDQLVPHRPPANRAARGDLGKKA